jgi:hypothetical protein
MLGTAFAVDMISRYAVGGGYENINFFVTHFAVKFGSLDFENGRLARSLA